MMVFIKVIRNFNGEIDLDIRNLKTFIQVCESGSFTKAGEQLAYSQSTVSIQIKQLEDELGIKLFDRIGNTVRITDKGREALAYAQQICNMCQEMVHSGSGEELKGQVRIAMADSLCAPLFENSFAQFRQKHPKISIKVITGDTNEMFGMLDHNEVDVVCTLDSHRFNTNYVIAAEERVAVHFVASSNDPFAGEENLKLEQLVNRDFILTEKNMSYRRIMDEHFAAKSLEIIPILELGRAETICDLVAQGLGLSCLPDYVTDKAVKEGRVVRLNVPECKLEVWKQLVYHRDKWLSPQMKAVISHLGAAI